MAPTPEQWRDSLYPKLRGRIAELQKYEDYYVGKHPLPFLTKAHADKMMGPFRQMLDESQTNFMRLIIDTVAERLRIEGIRLSASSDPTSDKDSWDIWQANQMDSLHSDAILDALIKKVSYLSVWEDSNGDGYPDINVEDAKECIVAYTPGSNFRKRDAALKVWRDEVAGQERCTLYLPDMVYRWYRDIGKNQPAGPEQQKIFDPDVPFRLEPGDVDSRGTVTVMSGGGLTGDWKGMEQYEVPNKMGVVPIIPIRNRGRLLVEGESEIADSIHIQKQINSFLFLLALAGYFGAHRQRWAVGLELVEDKDGNVEEPFDIAIDKLLTSEDGDVKFGEFSQTDMSGYLKTIDQKAGHLAIQNKLPKHYFLPEGQAPSGDSIESSESGLIRKAKDKSTRYDDAFEEALRLARKLKFGEDTPVDSEMVWSNPATVSESAIADSVIKKYEAGLITKEQALEDLGYTQTQISRIMRTGAAEDLIKAASEPDESEEQVK